MEKDNRRTIETWLQHYNAGRLHELIVDCYAPSFVLRIMGGPTLTRYEEFLAFEQSVVAVAPRRRLVLDHVHACGDRVLVLEAVLFDPDRGPEWRLPWCTVMTFENGRIIEDRNYLDFGHWPAHQAFTPAAVAA
jgi:ketosteroid isomerase-like protein